ncbi:MAG: hypothetical protein U1A07_20180, partial [Phenylobacterium sp.]|nr:hypothetical protein [Phenylobacterium sp.]
MEDDISNEELMALLNGGGAVQPVDALTGQPLPAPQAQTYRQLGAAGGIDPAAEPGSARFPLAQRAPEDIPAAGQFYVEPGGLVRQAPADAGGGLGGAIDDRVRAFARGVPVLGSWADESSAAFNATFAPAIEPLLRGIEGLGIPTPYDEASRLTGEGVDWSDRYRTG